MRVESIKAFPIKVRMKEKLVAGSFMYSDYQTVLVRVSCDGETGWGEAMTRSGPAATAVLIDGYLGPMVVGKDFESPKSIWQAIWGALRVRGHTRGIDLEGLSGIEIAVYDAYARMKKSSLASLLSRRIVNAVPAFAGSLFSSRGPLKGQVELAKSLGLMGAKVKVGFGADKDFEVLGEVRKIWDDCELVADANGAYDAATAVKVAKRVEPLKLAWFEEPVPADDIEGYRKISRATSTPLGAGEAWFVSDFVLPLREKLIEVVEPSVSRSGGVGVVWDVSQEASRRRIGFAPMVGMNSAISMAASLQLAAGSENLVGVEFDPFNNPLLTEVCPGFPRLEKGELVLPEGYGLGVDVDMGFVKRNLVT